MSELFISQREYDIMSNALGLHKVILDKDIQYEVNDIEYISPRLGHKNTPEHIELIRQAHLGKKRSVETREKISVAARKTYANGRKGMSGTTGMKFSDQTRKKMSEKRKEFLNNNQPLGGWTFKRSDESNKKSSESAKGRRRLYKEDGTWSWYYPSKINA